MIAAAFAEIVSIGSILPFLSVLTDPKRFFSYSVIQPVIHIMGLTSQKQMLFVLTIGFGFVALIAGGIRLLLLWFNIRLSFAMGADISISIYNRTLYQPYKVHVSRNSSELISAISTKTDNVIFGVLVSLLMVISSMIMLITIMSALFFIDPVIALLAMSGFGVIYVIIIRFSRKSMLKNSQCTARESTQVIKSLQEGLGGIRDVLIDGSQAVYCANFMNANLSLRRAQGNNMFISESPRFGLEALGMMLIATLAYIIANQPDGIARAIPLLGALALGAQRMLPILQQAYRGLSNMQGSQAALKEVLDLLDQPLRDDAVIPVSEALKFHKEIDLSNLSFRYTEHTPYILQNLNLLIKKGSRVGFIGATGSGKSTLLDIIMGLLDPTKGEIRIDNTTLSQKNRRSWQAHIAHVPQVIFLADKSIEENIAFGVSIKDIDHGRVRQAAQQAQISGIIEGWPKKYQTIVGERGIRLSGGQRQRIGIARALYKKADVIIFDEATSALDNQTEAAVMQAIEDLHDDITILIIAHRLTTLRNCTQVVELEKGVIKRKGSYEEIVSDDMQNINY